MSNLEILNREFPRLRKKLDFGEFHPDLGGNSVNVWLNLSADFEERIAAHTELRRRIAALEAEEEPGEDLVALQEELTQGSTEIYSTMWDIEPAEVQALIGLDLGLTEWLFRRTWEMVRAYREGYTKNLMTG